MAQEFIEATGNENEDYWQVQASILENNLKATEKRLGDAERLIKALDRGTGSGSGEGSGSRINAYLAGRRSMVWELRESGGMPRGMNGVEVMYLLPDEFVLFYEDLYCRALGVGMGSPAGTASKRDGGVGKAKGNTRTVLGSESRAQAQGGGKRYRDSPMVVKSERMLNVKGYVDQSLMDLVHGVQKMMSEKKIVVPRGREVVRDGRTKKIAGSRSVEIEGQGPGQGQGAPLESAARGDSRGKGSFDEIGDEIFRCSGDGCRRYMKADWKFCPSCGAKSESRTLSLDKE